MQIRCLAAVCHPLIAVLFAALWSSTSVTAQVAPRLLLYLDLDESPASNGTVLANRAIRSAGNATLHTNNGSLNKSVPGMAGNAIYFDGGSEYIDATAFDAPDSFSITLWANPAAAPGESTPANRQAFVGKHTSSGGNQVVLGLYGGYHFSLRGKTFQAGTPSTGWQHIAVVVSRIDASHSEATFYLDGEVLWRQVLDAVLGNVAGGRAWTFGQEWDAAGRSDYFRGVLDEVAIWDRALTEEQIGLLMDQRGLDVTTKTDSGAGSLRAAIAGAAADDRLSFAPELSGETITLSSGQIVLDQDLDIDATSLEATPLIRAGSNSRIFEVTSGNLVRLRGLRLTNGNAALGGGAIRNGGTLELHDTTVSENISALRGGGIFNEPSGVTRLIRSAVLQNQALGSSGGGIFNDGGTITSTNSTLVGNDSEGSGGGIGSEGGVLNLTHTTITDNTAQGGGGGIATNASLALANTLVAGNSADSDPEIAGVVTVSSGVNLTEGDPQLAALGQYGGRSPCAPPLPGSPAVDAGLSLPLAEDQRGAPRPAGAQPDIGAVEYQPAVVTTAIDENDLPEGPALSLREAIDRAFVSTITFDPSMAGAVCMLNGGNLSTRRSLRIDASGLAGAVAIDADLSSNIFEVASDQTLVLDSLIVRGGTADDGGAVINEGTLIVEKSTFSGNTAAAGGAIANQGKAVIRDSTLTENTASFGGAIRNRLGLLDIRDSSIADNQTATGGRGGGIDNQDGNVLLENVEITGNGSYDATVRGGGLHADGGELNLTDCKVSGNKGEGGGGLALSGSATLTAIRGEISDNQAAFDGGGGLLIDEGSSASLNGTLISGNSASGAGGAGIYKTGSSGSLIVTALTIADNACDGSFDGGGIWDDSTGSFKMTTCSVLRNSGGQGGGVAIGSGGGSGNRSAVIVLSLFEANESRGTGGGAIYCDANLIMENSTLAGGTAERAGGGIYFESGAHTLHLCTIVGNTSGVTSLTDVGGGAYLKAGTMVELHNTVIAGNTNAGPDPAAPDLAAPSGTITTAGVNFIGDPTGSALVAGPALLTGDPRLSPLGKFGSGPPCMLPLPGSPLIDPVGGDSSTTAAYDQRGLRPRLVGATVDIGAAEYNAAVDLDQLWGLDFDGDGHCFGQEQALGTDPFLPDAGDPRNVIGPNFNAMGQTEFTLALDPDALARTIWILKRSSTLAPGSFAEIYRFHGPSLMDTLTPGIVSTPDSLPTPTSIRITDQAPPAPRAFYILEFEAVPSFEPGS